MGKPASLFKSIVSSNVEVLAKILEIKSQHQVDVLMFPNNQDVYSIKGTNTNCIKA